MLVQVDISKVSTRNMEAIALHSKIFHQKIMPDKKRASKSGYKKHKREVMDTDG